MVKRLVSHGINLRTSHGKLMSHHSGVREALSDSICDCKQAGGLISGGIVWREARDFTEDVQKRDGVSAEGMSGERRWDLFSICDLLDGLGCSEGIGYAHVIGPQKLHELLTVTIHVVVNVILALSEDMWTQLYGLALLSTL